MSEEKEQITFYGKKYEQAITYLRLAYEPVKNLKEFQIFPNLKSISLIQHDLDVQIEKIEHTHLFPQLESLFLFGNKIQFIPKSNNFFKIMKKSRRFVLSSGNIGKLPF